MKTIKKLFELGNRYAEDSDWKDFALVKFCLCAMGIIIGANIPKKYKTQTTGIAAGVFAITYVPLMAKVVKIAKDMMEK
ncbi:MAG: permease of phosphate ABC transporter [Lachnospiraceae bacterium]|nr:permease of phosphate ABC transporter [Lachnospiraceae bacterium]